MNGASDTNVSSSMSKYQQKKALKNAMKRKKRKEKKQTSKNQESEEKSIDQKKETVQIIKPDVEVVYVTSNDATEIKKLAEENIEYAALAEVFAKFQSVEELLNEKPEAETETENNDEMDKKAQVDTQYNEDEINSNKPLSKKKRKILERLSVAELKQLVKRPDVVESHDVTAQDPRLLVYLKSYRNTVPVPRHWLKKSKYLQGKRGFEKPPFALPKFIEDTGISKVRGASDEKDEEKSLRQKTRERMSGAMGKVAVDYGILYNAFFKFQTKPLMTVHGDLYYEGKEFENGKKNFTPGRMSIHLKNALGMTDQLPPPWLIAMQRYGPPPSYPNLKTPGLNAPIPSGVSYGYHAGGWGKPPVDEMGKPVYGDVFGVNDQVEEVEIDKTHWGMPDPDEEESEDESEEEMEEEEELEEESEYTDLSGIETPAIDGFTSTVSGISGITTPGTINLRKGVETPQQLYQILDTKDNKVGSEDLFGTAHTYALPGAAPKNFDVALDPEEMANMDSEQLKMKYDERMEESEAAANAERAGVAEMMHEQQRRNKRKMKGGESSKSKRRKEDKSLKHMF